MLQLEISKLALQEVEATLTMIVTWRKAVSEIHDHVSCTGEYPEKLAELLEASFKARERGLSDLRDQLTSLPW